MSYVVFGIVEEGRSRDDDEFELCAAAIRPEIAKERESKQRSANRENLGRLLLKPRQRQCRSSSSSAIGTPTNSAALSILSGVYSCVANCLGLAAAANCSEAAVDCFCIAPLAKMCVASLILCLRASPRTRTVAPPPRRSSSSSAPPPANLRTSPSLRAFLELRVRFRLQFCPRIWLPFGVDIKYHDAPRELLRAADKRCAYASAQLRVPTGHKCGWLLTRRRPPLAPPSSEIPSQPLRIPLNGPASASQIPPDPFRFLASVLRILLSPLCATFVSLVSAAAACLRSSICI
ncbi:hypothetical protein FB451DRAFT_1570151 [Mycena latifolia]|nr:hypothetical protein FB451DRAFT_1570151 [Mycena latifolia]